MFDRPGKELKKRAEDYVLWRTMAATVLGAISTFIVIPMLIRENAALMGIVIMGVMIAVPVITYNVCKTKALTLYAMGQLVDDMQTIRELMQTSTPENGGDTAKAAASVLDNNSSETKDVPVRTTIIPVDIVNGKLICPICGTAQSTDRDVCQKCGQRFRM